MESQAAAEPSDLHEGEEGGVEPSDLHEGEEGGVEPSDLHEGEEGGVEPSDLHEGEEGGVEPSDLHEGEEGGVEPSDLHEGEEGGVEPSDLHEGEEGGAGRKKTEPDRHQDGENRRGKERRTTENGSTNEGGRKELMAGEALDRRKRWEPSFFYSVGKESFFFAGHDISIHESLDSYGALIWPGAVALCQFLENNSQQVNLMDKAVLEIGAGTGLLSIVASLLGAWVTATDLPEILSNLTFNLSRNTKGRCRYTPQVTTLNWGRDLERDFPLSACHYDYILAADVVYHHDNLDELLATMRHFLRPGSGTTLLWANKVRFQSDVRFTESFQSSFNATLLSTLPLQEVHIYRATARD